MKLEFFYGLSIVSLVRGLLDNYDIDVTVKVGGGSWKEGQGAEERAKWSLPEVWCDPEQGWQQSPNGICYLIEPQNKNYIAARQFCQSLGHDIIEWSQETNAEFKTIVGNHDSAQHAFAGAYRDGVTSWVDKDGNAADVSSLGTEITDQGCTVFSKSRQGRDAILRFTGCTLAAYPICQWSRQ